MPAALLLDAIALLIVALMAPVCLLARAALLKGRARESLHRILTRLHARGGALLYEGEDAAMAQKRLDRCIWIARDPVGAFRRLIRRERGLIRARLGGEFVQPGFCPPLLACAALASPHAYAASPDTS